MESSTIAKPRVEKSLQSVPTSERYVLEPVTHGSGGFGHVQVGKDIALERKIAVKTLDPVWEQALEEDKERFKREAKILAQLNHPNIPAIYDVVQSNDSFEIIFQYVEGETLRKIITDDLANIQQCRIWFDQIASALHHAHERGIIHRDVKPENLIVSPDRKHCYLVDFGIALSQEEMTRLTGSDNWIGTPGYMSPEQEEAKELDPSDDLYVLGGCLYEALCGHRIQQGNYQPLNSINELIPPAIDNLVKKCIAPKPQRLDSADEFRKILKNALHGHRTLSETLVNGQLHEIAAAIRDMSPSAFMEMNPGQRLLILQKCHNLIAEESPKFKAAKIEFITILTGLGVHLKPEQYARVIKPAIRFGFGYLSKEGGPAPPGNYQIREEIFNSAVEVKGENHHIMVSELTEWLNDINAAIQKNWFYHSVRQFLNALLANPHCSGEDAIPLAEKLAQMDDLQRSHGQDGEQDYSEELIGG